MARNYPASISVDDMVQEARIGLIQAARRFETERGVPFAPYATTRIRGAIVDAFRRRMYAEATQRELTDKQAERLPDGSDLEEDVHWRRRCQKLRVAMASVMSRDDAAMLLERVDGATYAEIGHKRDRSGSWACHRLHRSRTKLMALVATGELEGDHR